LFVLLALWPMEASTAMEPYPDLDSLRVAVIEHLKRLDKVKSVAAMADDPGMIAVELKNDNGETHKIYVGNLFGRIAGLDAHETAEAIESFVAMATRSAPPAARDLTTVYANLRPRNWIEDKNLEDSSMFADEFLADVVILYQLRDDGMLASVERSELDAAGGPAAVRAAALANNAALLAELEAHDYGEVASIYFLADSPSFSTGLLLTDAFREIVEARFPQGAFIAIPRRDDVVAFNRSRPDALERARNYVADVFEKNEPDLVSRSVFGWQNGKLVVVE
jgi:hypothetical protein